MLATTNMILHGIEVPTIEHDNLLNKTWANWTEKERVHVIVTNPPFGGMEEDGVENNFPQAFRTRETANLFMALIIHLLKDGGRCGLVLPDGFLFGEGVATRIKENLLEKCNLHTIVRLPNGVFNPYTQIKTNLLFFEKGKPTKDIWFFEHPYPDGQKSYSKTNTIKVKEFDLEKSWWNNRVENEYAWKVPVKTIFERGFNLDIKHPDSNIENREYSLHEVIEEIASRNSEIEILLNNLKSELYK